LIDFVSGSSFSHENVAPSFLRLQSSPPLSSDPILRHPRPRRYYIDKGGENGGNFLIEIKLDEIHF